MMTTKEENRKQARQAKRSQRKAKRERESDKKAERKQKAAKRQEKGAKTRTRKLNKKSAKNLVILAKITIKWRAAVCEAQGSPKGPKLMIKGIKEAQGRLREAQGTEKALKGTTSVLEAGLTPTPPPLKQNKSVGLQAPREKRPETQQGPKR